MFMCNKIKCFQLTPKPDADELHQINKQLSFGAGSTSIKFA